MRIENIGPDDIQVGDEMDDNTVVTHVVEPGLVVVRWKRGHVIYGWADNAWRLDGDAQSGPRTAHRDVPDKWKRQDVNRVGPKGSPWVFIVDYSSSLDCGPAEAWADDIVEQTAQWLTDRLNEGHFGEMPSSDDRAV